MCFTPAISLTTAIIEFVVATFILIKYKKYVVPVFFAVLIYVLGIYQFTEFMLCTSSNAFLWAKLGFITYTFLPAIALHFVLRLAKNRKHNWLVYIPPLFFSIWAAIKTDFIAHVSCSQLFVTSQKAILFPGYSLYYSGFILATIIIAFILVRKEKDKTTKQLAMLLGSATIIIVALPILLISILPSLKIQFASVYCEFALLYTIIALIGSRIYSKRKKKEVF
ncbi:histidine kinase N-terminal 7TM domain-containing protein [Nanoarchaeota archaeon]